MGSYQRVSGKEKKNYLGSNSFFIGGRDSQNSTVTVYSGI
jgi:hypothetical protein